MTQQRPSTPARWERLVKVSIGFSSLLACKCTSHLGTESQLIQSFIMLILSRSSQVINMRHLREGTGLERTETTLISFVSIGRRSIRLSIHTKCSCSQTLKLTTNRLRLGQKSKQSGSIHQAMPRCLIKDSMMSTTQTGDLIPFTMS